MGVRGLIVAAALTVFVGLVAGYVITMPAALSETAWSGLGEGDVRKGETLFWAGGCASCHAAPDSEADALYELSGGLALETPYGVFHVPNISSDPDAGLGNWSLADFGHAMVEGVGPDGQHLYPSFPYASYARMTRSDINDLWAFLKTLPASDRPSQDHDLMFPYSIRMGIGVWKAFYLDPDPVIVMDDSDPVLVRGRYLAEGPGHCGECHTPRNWLGGMKRDMWFAGAPNPEGEGVIPNITPGGAIADWPLSDIVYYFESGFTPEFDVVGGSMAKVQRNLARLDAGDREAIAAYLKTLPARENGYPSSRPSGS